MKNIAPSVVGAVVVLAMNVIKGSFAVTLGKKTRTELANKIVKDTFIAACALIGESVSQTFIEIPVLGYLIGSFVGSVVGSFTYDYGYKKALSFYVDKSLDGVRPCTRYKEIEVDYLDQNFRPKHGKYSGRTAQIIQHELDHVAGIVI